MPGIARIHEQGGPEVLTYEDAAVPTPQSGELLLRQTAIGVNYLDAYFRSGHFSAPGSPFVTGFEGAGIVEAIGPDVEGFSVGDRVAYQLAMGAYAHYRTVPIARCVKVPAGITDEQAASMMLKGMTAEYLANRVRRPGKGDVVLVHAAAGGVGSILTQWLAHNAAEVIGTVGSEEKARLVSDRGVAHVINYRENDFIAVVNDLTEGRGVDVAYDGVGQATFIKTFDCLAAFGTNVLFGWASGKVGAIDIDTLNAKSHEVVNPSLGHYTGTRDRFDASAASLFAAVASGAIRIEPAHRYALSDAATAHADLEGRRTGGPIILIPDEVP